MSALYKLSTSLDREVPIIHIAGEITSEAEDELKRQYDSIPDDKRERIVIDFTETKYINSAGIAILIGLITRATDNKMKIEFSGLNPHFRKVMDIVGLTDFVTIFDNLDEALESQLR